MHCIHLLVIMAARVMHFPSALVYYVSSHFSECSTSELLPEVMARRSHLPSDPAFLLEYMQDLPVESDSDGEFDGLSRSRRRG